MKLNFNVYKPILDCKIIFYYYEVGIVNDIKYKLKKYIP